MTLKVLFASACAFALVAACGQQNAAQAPAAGGSPTQPTGAVSAPAGAPGASAAPSAQGAVAGAQSTAATASAFAARTGELLNPEAKQVIALYYSLTQLPAPVDDWVKRDYRAISGNQFEQEKRKAQVKAELDALLASVANVGKLRVTLNANLSQYDPTYGEYYLSVFAPSSSIPYRDLGQDVSLKFKNGRQAQIWKVPTKEEAQAIMDRAGGTTRVVVDALLDIVEVQPGANGGDILANVKEFEVRANNGTVLGRLVVP